MRRHQSSSWRGRRADGVSLSLSCDTEVYRGCAGGERRDTGGCAGEEGVLSQEFFLLIIVNHIHTELGILI